jgi:hypothetical protein
MLSRVEEILFASLVEPGYDLYLPKVAYFWYTLTLVEGYEDLVPERIGSWEDTPFTPKEDEFDPWQEVLENIGIEDLLDVDYQTSLPWLTWGLQHGVLPGQEFLVMITRPRWVRAGYEYIEHDIEVEAEVVRIEPTEVGVRLLERDFNRIMHNRKEAADRREALSSEAMRVTRQRAMLSSFRALYGEPCEP